MFYRFLKTLFAAIVKIAFKVEFREGPGFPKEGAFILCSNHTSWWDPVLLAVLCPRDLHFMAKKELFELPLLGPLFHKINAFPVDRKKADVRAIKEAISRLKAGRVLGIFPEGTRNKGNENLGIVHGGAALLAIKGGAPVVPVAIRGSYNFRRSVWVTVGDPLVITRNAGRLSSDVDDGSQRIALSLNQLLARSPSEGAA